MDFKKLFIKEILLCFYVASCILFILSLIIIEAKINGVTYIMNSVFFVLTIISVFITRIIYEKYTEKYYKEKNIIK